MSKKTPAQKARRKARSQATAAAERMKCAALKAQGNCCEVCQHKGWRGAGVLICELGSDFHGYQPVKPGHVCGQFENQI